MISFLFYLFWFKDVKIKKKEREEGKNMEMPYDDENYYVFQDEEEEYYSFSIYDKRRAVRLDILMNKGRITNTVVFYNDGKKPIIEEYVWKITLNEMEKMCKKEGKCLLLNSKEAKEYVSFSILKELTKRQYKRVAPYELNRLINKYEKGSSYKFCYASEKSEEMLKRYTLFEAVEQELREVYKNYLLFDYEEKREKFDYFFYLDGFVGFIHRMWKNNQMYVQIFDREKEIECEKGCKTVEEIQLFLNEAMKKIEKKQRVKTMFYPNERFFVSFLKKATKTLYNGGTLFEKIKEKMEDTYDKAELEKEAAKCIKEKRIISRILDEISIFPFMNQYLMIDEKKHQLYIIDDEENVKEKIKKHYLEIKEQLFEQEMENFKEKGE